MEQNFIIDSSELSPEAREKKRQIENNPACRTNPMEVEAFQVRRILEEVTGRV